MKYLLHTLLGLFVLIALNGCSLLFPKTYEYPDWFQQGTYFEDSSRSFPSSWLFDEESISHFYQDPDYQYIEVTIHDFHPAEESAPLTIGSDYFEFTSWAGIIYRFNNLSNDRISVTTTIDGTVYPGVYEFYLY